jgi:membrane protein required for colicin V production
LEIIDIILILLLAFGGYKGYQTGLLIQIITFLAFIIAVITAFHLAQSGVVSLKKWLNLSESLLPVISFIIIFLIVLLIIILFGRFLTTILHQTLLGSIDQYAGAFVGILQTAFGLGCILWLLQKSGLKIPTEYTNESFVYPWLTEYSPGIIKFISTIIPFKDIMNKVEETLQKH